MDSSPHAARSSRFLSVFYNLESVFQRLRDNNDEDFLGDAASSCFEGVGCILLTQALTVSGQFISGGAIHSDLLTFLGNLTSLKEWTSTIPEPDSQSLPEHMEGHPDRQESIESSVKDL